MDIYIQIQENKMEQIATFIFYAIGIIAITYEMFVLYGTKKFVNFYKRIHEKINNGNKGKRSNFDSKDNTYAFLMYSYLIWSMIGLISSQWLLFLIIIILGKIPGKNYYWIAKIDSFLSLSILIFILINKYHLHINLLELIINKI